MTENTSGLGRVMIIQPEDSENAVLDQLDEKYKQISQMSVKERYFLNTLLQRYKPKKILEIGVFLGGSSIVILNAIKDNPEATLYSVDYLDSHGIADGKKTGYFVDEYPELKSKWRLYTGGLSCDFMDDIGEGIDFCFIDTMHYNPGEILDFLFALPFLKDDAVIVFHDTALQTSNVLSNTNWSITNAMLISAIYGTKLLQGNFSRASETDYPSVDGVTYMPNISGVVLEAESRNRLYEIFNLLSIRWLYSPSKKEEAAILDYFKRFYNEFYVNFVKDIFVFERMLIDYCDSRSPRRGIYNVLNRLLGRNVKIFIGKTLGKKLTQKLLRLFG